METHALHLADLPHFMRLVGQGILLDSAMMSSLDGDVPQESPLAPLLPTRNLHTLVTRGKQQTVLGQFRLVRSEWAAPRAQLTYLAPRALAHTDESACLHLLDALTAAAGRREAHSLNAEVDERSPLFETMRRAGFAVYARQELWRRAGYSNRAGNAAHSGAGIPWQKASAGDRAEMRQLLRSLVPPMLLQTLEQPAANAGWLYREEGQVLAILALRRGRRAASLLPYFHPRLAGRIADLLRGALALLPARQPCFLTLRRYQDWWGETLPALGFLRQVQQGLLVRHIATSIRAKHFADELLEALEKGITPALEMRTVPPPFQQPTRRSA
ncbi:MAG: hypothetical protein OXF83_09205 [Anaerolineaceae bacterium]|nr:hypothetical protein [Anaerolineaceae bacterium]